REWTSDDVPPGPYFHGSRRLYESGESLPTDVVNNMEGEEDDRQMCFASTRPEDALGWAYQRGIGRGDTLYVYEVDMLDPEVDVNAHPPGSDDPITSVMSSRGRVVRIAQQVALADYPDAVF